MAKLIPLKVELKRALDLLRENDCQRAANLFESAPAAKRILHPSPKPKKTVNRAVRIVGGSGRAFPAKLAVPARSLGK